MRIYILIAALLVVAVCEGFYVPKAWKPYEYITLYNATSNEYTVQKAKKTAPKGLIISCRALYNESFKDVGWDYVHIAPTTEFIASMGADAAFYAAGLTEGYLTAAAIAARVLLVNHSKEVSDWVAVHQRYMTERSSANSEQTSKKQSKFWRGVSRIFHQLSGLADGYAMSNSSQQRTLSKDDLFYWNFRADLRDVINALNSSEESEKVDLGHCTAVVKVTDDDLFVSHNTWLDYGKMVRQFKVYEFSTSVMLSGYAGTLHSADDFYLTSNGLAVQETTLNVFNRSIWRLVTPRSVSEFIRVMVANYEASSGKEWGELFAYNNSGTFNNQYMVVDMKLFTPGKPLQNNTLWIYEQMPGSVTSADLTDVLRKQSYWASYNIPYFANVSRMSGYDAAVKQFGSFWSYTKHPRARMFRAMESTMNSLQGVKNAMRYNNYLHDPFALIPNCNGTASGNCTPPYSAMLALASRGDLNPTGNMSNYGPLWKLVGQMNLAAIDAKVSSWRMLHSTSINRFVLKATAICGPTANVSDTHVPFLWSTSPWGAEQRPSDAPDLYDFDWVNYALPVAAPGGDNSALLARWQKGIGIGLISFSVLLAFVAFLIRHAPVKTEDERRSILSNSSCSQCGWAS